MRWGQAAFLHRINPTRPGRLSHTTVQIGSFWKLYQLAESVSVGLGLGLRVCIATKHPEDADVERTPVRYILVAGWDVQLLRCPPLTVDGWGVSSSKIPDS